jgi:hypothetical protein
VHLNAFLSVPLARFAPSPRPIEAESSGTIAAYLGLRQPGEELADVIEDPRIGRGIRRRSRSQGLLIDRDHLVDLFDSDQLLERAGQIPGIV